VRRPENYFPFLDGEYSDWWGNEAFYLHKRPYDRWTQLLSLTKETDWLGSNLVLIPPKEVLEVSNIHMSGFGNSLVWSDNDGQPVLACRFWRVRGNQFSDAESDKLIGSDLIVRPDLVEKLEAFFSTSLKTYTHVSKEIISD